MSAPIWVVMVDHAYEDEIEYHRSTEAEAQALATEKRQDPYVKRVDVYPYPGQEI